MRPLVYRFATCDVSCGSPLLFYRICAASGCHIPSSLYAPTCGFAVLPFPYIRAPSGLPLFSISTLTIKPLARRYRTCGFAISTYYRGPPTTRGLHFYHFRHIAESPRLPFLAPAAPDACMLPILPYAPYYRAFWLSVFAYFQVCRCLNRFRILNAPMALSF